MTTEPEQNQKGRRKILYWITAGLSVLISWKWVGTPKKEQKAEKPVKMLTEDGQLVEVDPRYLAGTGKKATPDDIHNWITTKK